MSIWLWAFWVCAVWTSVFVGVSTGGYVERKRIGWYVDAYGSEKLFVHKDGATRVYVVVTEAEYVDYRLRASWAKAARAMDRKGA